ncbi:MAG: extracellular solute-binding protein, partial [Microcystaceae cyanobacterium]
MFKKLGKFALLGCCGLLLSWLISCQTAPTTDQTAANSTATPGATSGAIEFWTMQLQPKHTDFFNGLISTFTKENAGVQVTWLDIPWEAMQSKILTAVSANTAPDVVNLNPPFASQLATKNAWLNLSEEVPKEIQAQYLPKLWQANTLNNVTFGVPWYVTTRITIYNQELLKKA